MNLEIKSSTEFEIRTFKAKLAEGVVEALELLCLIGLVYIDRKLGRSIAGLSLNYSRWGCSS